MKKYILSIFLLVGTTQIFSQVLSINGPERKQLIAMGYELDKEEAADVYTVANNGVNKMAFTKNKDRLAVSRYYTRKTLNQKDEFELMKIINQYNADYSYQVSLSDTLVIVTLYDHGTYDPKTFLKLVRMMEKADSMFDYNTKILRLINE